MSYSSDSGHSSGTVIKRPNCQECKDALSAHMSYSQTGDAIVPTKLRPEKHDDKNIDSLFLQSEVSEENIIVNVNELANLITVFLPHICENTCPTIKIAKRQGLCVTIQVTYKNCPFKSGLVDLFTRSNMSPRGPPAYTFNTSLLIPVLKSKVGISDVLLTLTCDIQTPDRRGFQRILNKMSNLMIQLNENQMIENQNIKTMSSIYLKWSVRIFG